jgi:hypothetical protein
MDGGCMHGVGKVSETFRVVFQVRDSCGITVHDRGEQLDMLVVLRARRINSYLEPQEAYHLLLPYACTTVIIIMLPYSKKGFRGLLWK